MKTTAGINTNADPAGFGDTGAAQTTEEPQNFRRLKGDELVRHGDFVKDGHRGFELWEGPGGFRADAFVKATYRRQTPQPAAAGKAA